MVNTPSNPGEHESFIRIEGILSLEDQQSVTGYIIGKLGVNATYLGDTLEIEPRIFSVPEAQQEAIQNHGFRFSDISSRDDILVREHFEDLGSTNPEIDNKTVVRAFHKLMDERGIGSLFAFDPTIVGNSRMRQVREPKPTSGVIIVERAAIGLSPYKGSHLTEKEASIMSKYGMVVGSTLDALEKTFSVNTSKMNQTQKTLKQISLLLKSQIEQ